MNQAILGVDPGVRGGLAVLTAEGRPVHVRALDPTMTELDLDCALRQAVDVLDHHWSRTCYFERVGFIRGDGGKGAFTFGKIVGLLRGGLRARGVEIHDVSPMIWQAKMECLTGGNKNVSKNRAIELFGPIVNGQKITHATADALLISEYGRRMNAAFTPDPSPF